MGKTSGTKILHWSTPTTLFQILRLGVLLCNSSICELGKAIVFKKLISNKHLQEVALVFTARSWSDEEIEPSGNKVMSNIIKGNTDQTFNSLRHKRLNEKVSTAKYFVKLQMFRPTEKATKYYIFRTYFQII